MHQLSSSLRIRSTLDSLRLARKLAPHLGITRVTDTTRLDKIGIPVFASIRPDAAAGSLCVNAGKGMYSAEAEIGAYMEAIEFAYAEQRRSENLTLMSTPREIADLLAPASFVDLCPLIGYSAKSNAPIAAARAYEWETDRPLLIPAELVFLPLSSPPRQTLFGTSSNGLCSGNSVEEALVHGLCELLERDVQAFNYVQDASTLVDLRSIPARLHVLIDKIKAANLTLAVRFTPNIFGFPYFQAFVMEANPDISINIAVGTGLHPVKEIAFARAVCEAAQSRLSHIHGGRDDIIDRVKRFEASGRQTELQSIRKLRHYATSGSEFSFVKIKSESCEAQSTGEIVNLIKGRLSRATSGMIAITKFTPDDAQLHVIRVVAPGLESFDHNLQRVGPRLLRCARGQ